MFSEAILASSVPGTTAITETDPIGGGNDTLTVTNLTSGARALGVNSYVNANNTSASFASSTLSVAGADGDGDRSRRLHGDAHQSQGGPARARIRPGRDDHLHRRQHGLGHVHDGGDPPSVLAPRGAGGLTEGLQRAPVSLGTVMRLGLVLLYVEDFPRVLAFYRDTLGFRVTFDDPGTGHKPGIDWAQLELDGGQLELFDHAVFARGREFPFPRRNASVITFCVDDVDARVEELRGKGVEIPYVHSAEWGKAAHFFDPEGNELQVFQAY